MTTYKYEYDIITADANGIQMLLDDAIGDGYTPIFMATCYKTPNSASTMVTVMLRKEITPKVEAPFADSEVRKFATDRGWGEAADGTLVPPRAFVGLAP